MTANREVRVFDDLGALSEAAASEIAAIAHAATAERGRFSIALSGGNTPRRTYELLAERYRDAIDWVRTDVIFGDERYVPPEDARSNYKMAREALLERVSIPAERIHAVPTDAPTVSDAAEQYDRTLRGLFDGPATVDLALLGVGPDGHTASLFPGSPALDERTRWAVAVDAPTTVQPAVARVTTTFPFINGARAVIVLIAGADKHRVVSEILGGAEAALAYPAARVTPRGRSLWMVERAVLPA